MAGRRQQARFEIANTEGVLRLLTDVSVHRGTASEFFATGCDAGAPGDVVTIHIVGACDLRVRVLDSRPVLVNGSVRHRLRLETLSRLDQSVGRGAACEAE
jgi:hypothetical protein